MTAPQAVEVIREQCGVEPTLEAGVVTVRVPASRWQAVARTLRDEVGCRYFNWLSAVDWKDKGLEVVCRLEDLEHGLVVMLRCELPPGQAHCPTLSGLFRGADWMERECYDLLGVTFDGHPDLRRILLSEDWEGHPLRKDYAVDMPFTPYR
ncbi:NADH-quinone oxidoreductase subunit C [Longimicrobium sp.]|uniref:NADH-quinone oxidoreductase subunit C n=1 Tax=Longimicrobium sp. TaxID=2029185 RepID=UPI002E3653A7|nr:NADH-quinone oxidoreductase subunit C [Longimicrobium sp.]HEX6042294.1 NADH-quinone oxidoreductase subunit C [Longimicrobium sp.]